jgi:hypothetical protein
MIRSRGPVWVESARAREARGAALEHLRTRAPRRRVGVQRVRKLAAFAERDKQRLGVLDRLSRALAEVGLHRVCGVSQ